MRITGSAISLTVDDVPASSKFLATHFGFTERMATDGFASLRHDEAGYDIVFLRTGLEVLPPGLRDRRSAMVTDPSDVVYELVEWVPHSVVPNSVVPSR